MHKIFQKLKNLNPKYIIYITLVLILLFSFLTKTWQIGKIDQYMFDEVYVGFTAEEFAKGNIKAWVWDFSAPQGFAYGWSHPPLGKLVIAGSIKIFGQSPFSRRFPAALAGTAISFIIFLLAKHLFPKKPYLWLLAAALSSLEGLLLVLSRIALADTMLALCLLTAIYFCLKKKYLLSALFWGCGLSIKWTAVYFLGFLIIFLFSEQKWKKKKSCMISIKLPFSNISPCILSI